MNLKLIVADNCETCRRTTAELTEFVHGKNNLNFEISTKTDECPVPVFIFPALFVDDELYNYGEVDLDLLKKHIESRENRLSA